jgi:hypothetical protein
LQPDIPFHQLPDQLDQVLQRAAETVKLPDHQHIACAQVGQQRIELGAVGAGTTGDLAVQLVAAGLVEGVGLQVETLIPGADPRVADLQ